MSNSSCIWTYAPGSGVPVASVLDSVMGSSGEGITPYATRSARGGLTLTNTATDVYYDPYDWEIDTDPYPVWKRLRDEAPLYYNERYDFFAVSGYDDVDACSVDW